MKKITDVQYILVLQFLIAYFIAPAPTILSIVLSPGLVVGDFLLNQIGMSESYLDNFTNAHHLFAIANLFNFIYYIAIIILLRRVFRRK